MGLRLLLLRSRRRFHLRRRRYNPLRLRHRLGLVQAQRRTRGEHVPTPLHLAIFRSRWEGWQARAVLVLLLLL